MVLEILADAFERYLRFDAVLRQFVRIADAGKHQHLRRVDHPTCKDHLARGAGDFCLTVVAILDADGALAFDQDARDQCLCLNLEILARHRRAQIGERRAATAAIADGVLVTADSFVLGAIQVVVPRDADGERGLCIRVEQRILEGREPR